MTLNEEGGAAGREDAGAVEEVFVIHAIRELREWAQRNYQPELTRLFNFPDYN